MSQNNSEIDLNPVLIKTKVTIYCFLLRENELFEKYPCIKNYIPHLGTLDVSPIKSMLNGTP